jgi:hypothetical protein
MKYRLGLLAALFLALGAADVRAQERTIRGTVTDDVTGAPVSFQKTDANRLFDFDPCLLRMDIEVPIRVFPVPISAYPDVCSDRRRRDFFGSDSFSCVEFRCGIHGDDISNSVTRIHNTSAELPTNEMAGCF